MSEKSFQLQRQNILRNPYFKKIIHAQQLFVQNDEVFRSTYALNNFFL